MVNDDKFVINSTFEFIENETLEDGAFASLALNPHFNWIKFTLTDDLPNANKQRVPIEEFDNLIRTGYLAPIKMGDKEISIGHAGTRPIGVISNLKKIDNKILGLAAIWGIEKPDEVNLIKENHKKGVPQNLSWEILYTRSEVNADGITELRDTALRAATLVGMPAYEGRTQILSVASTEIVSTDAQTNSEVDNLMDEELQAKVTELGTALATKDTELAASNTELEELRQFKASVIKEQEDAQKLTDIKKRFSEAGIAKEETFFVENKDMLLGLSAEAMEFMVQEMVSFAAKTTVASAEGLPNIQGDERNYSDPKALGQALRTSKK